MRKKVIIIIGGLILVGAITAGLLYAFRPETPSEQTPAEQQFSAELPSLKQAAENESENVGAQTDYGVALYAVGEYDQAVEQYEKVIALDDTDATLYNNLANAYRDNGQNNEAIAAYESAIERDPTLQNSYSNLANLYQYRLNDVKKAIETYERGQVALGENSQIDLLLALALEADGQTDRAVSTLNAILQYDPDNTAAQATLDRIEQ